MTYVNVKALRKFGYSQRQIDELIIDDEWEYVGPPRNPRNKPTK